MIARLLDHLTTMLPDPIYLRAWSVNAFQIVFLRLGRSRPTFFTHVCLFSIPIGRKQLHDVATGIQTADLWCRKQSLNQLSHHHCIFVSQTWDEHRYLTKLFQTSHVTFEIEKKLQRNFRFLIYERMTRDFWLRSRKNNLNVNFVLPDANCSIIIKFWRIVSFCSNNGL